MIWIEGVMLALTLYLMFASVKTDIFNAIISNSLIIKSCIVFAVLDTIYYSIFARDYSGLFFTNIIGMTIISVLFYAYDIWAAGDTKLIFTIVLGIPARLYSWANFGPVPGFIIIVIVFSVAFAYVIIDSIIIGIKEKTLFDIKWSFPNIIDLVTSYLFTVGLLTIINFLIARISNNSIFDKGYLLTAIDLLLVLTIMRIREKINKRLFYLLTIVVWIGLIILNCFGLLTISINVDIKTWLIVFIIMILQMLAEKYNYKEIPTEDVKERMILSAITVLQFSPSRVKGLPKCTTEDLKARLTEENVEAILRWKNTKLGKDTIIIVRKIPFAIFIVIGTVMFLILEGLYAWKII